MDGSQLVAITIFLFTYVLIITGGRARETAGLLGAFLMISAGIFSSIEEIVGYVHIETLVVLFAIMVIVGVLREGHFFSYIAVLLLERVGLSPSKIFYAFILLTSVLSAFLDSVAVVLFMVAVTIQLSEVMEINPKPFIIAEIIAANVAGTATTIGDPPNIMISLSYNISFTEFAVNMGTLTILMLVVLFLYFRRIYGKELRGMKVAIRRLGVRPDDMISDRKIFLLGSFMFITFLILLVFSAPLGLSPALIGLGVAAALLFLGGDKLVPILERVEWSTLLFFGSIFIVVGGLAKVGVLDALAFGIAGIVGGNILLAILIVTWLSVLGSAFVGNIPFAVTMLPLVQGVANATSLPVTPMLWSLVLGCDVGGTATIIGTAAGIVASDVAKKQGYGISYKEYFRVGLMSVLLSVGVGTVFLFLRYGIIAV